MIKRILTVFFLFIFTVATTGVIITSHNCDMRKCKTESNCCSNDNDDCCTSISVFLKLNNDFRSAENQKIEIPINDFTFLINRIIYSPVNSLPVNNLFVDTSPPLLSGELSFLQNFRI